MAPRGRVLVKVESRPIESLILHLETERTIQIGEVVSGDVIGSEVLFSRFDPDTPDLRLQWVAENMVSIPARVIYCELV